MSPSTKTNLSKLKYKITDVLCFGATKSRATVKKYYSIWRQQQTTPIPNRCDIAKCKYHSNPLKWNEKPLILILDHINGNNIDNRPKNLRFVCPNCDSQLQTKGGANKNKVVNSKGGSFYIKNKFGKKSHHLIADPAHYPITANDATLVTSKKKIKEKNNI